MLRLRNECIAQCHRVLEGNTPLSVRRTLGLDAFNPTSTQPAKTDGSFSHPAGDDGFELHRFHLIHELSPFLGNRLHSLQTERGHSEIFQYVKMYWVSLMLFPLWSRTRQPVYAGWLVLFAYLLCDDVLQIHEKGGRALIGLWSLEPALGLRSQDFGELAVSGISGFILLALVYVLYKRSSEDAKAASRNLVLLCAIPVFFGVVVDMVHVLVGSGRIELLFGVVEDGGELLAVSMICWYVFNLLADRRGVPLSLRQLIRRGRLPAISGSLESLSHVENGQPLEGKDREGARVAGSTEVRPAAVVKTRGPK